MLPWSATGQIHKHMATSQAATLLLAFLIAALANGVMARGLRWLPQDRPNARSLHAGAVPRGGGIGIVLGVGMASLVSPGFALPALLALVFLLAVVSVMDDVRSLPVALRLGVHIGAAATFLWLYAPASWQPLAWLLAGAALVWMTNLYNFMDGADGLAGGMAVFGFSIYGIAAWLGGDASIALLAVAVAAAAAGFLLFNFHPAKIFMGDVGSIPLGFLAAAIGLLGYWRDLWPWALPVLVFSPFIVDASVTLVRRLLRGERVWLAHREHYYQRLVRLGFGHRATALLEYGLMAACAAAALVLLRRPESMLPLLLAWAVLYALLLVWLDRHWRAHER